MHDAGGRISDHLTRSALHLLRRTGRRPVTATVGSITDQWRPTIKPRFLVCFTLNNRRNLLHRRGCPPCAKNRLMRCNNPRDPNSRKSLDHLVSAGGDGLRKNDAELFRHIEVDCELEHRWQLDRQVAGRRTAQNASNVVRNAQTECDKTRTVTDKTPVPGHTRPLAHGRQARFKRHAGQDRNVTSKYRRRENSERIYACRTHAGECRWVVGWPIGKVCVSL